MASVPAVMGPTLRPICPMQSWGSQWKAKRRSRPCSSPAATTSSAPPGMTSSAGWKISLAERVSNPAPASSASTSAVPSTIVVWAS